MGMFDTIKVEMPLPDGWAPPEKAEFQSKSLDCMMDTYKLADGKLFRIERFWDQSGDAPVPLPDEEYPIPFHGEVRFYTSEPQATDANGRYRYKWHEYSAIFVRGNLIDFSTIPQPQDDDGPIETNAGG